MKSSVVASDMKKYQITVKKADEHKPNRKANEHFTASTMNTVAGSFVNSGKNVIDKGKMNSKKNLNKMGTCERDLFKSDDLKYDAPESRVGLKDVVKSFVNNTKLNLFEPSSGQPANKQGKQVEFAASKFVTNKNVNIIEKGKQLQPSTSKNTPGAKHNKRESFSVNTSPDKARFSKLAGFSQSVVVQKSDQSTDFIQSNFLCFEEILSNIKKFVENATSKSDFIIYASSLSNDVRDKFSLDQSLSLNEICCDINSIEEKATIIIEKLESRKGAYPEPQNYKTSLPCVVNLKNPSACLLDGNQQLRLESERRIQKYTSLFNSCKKTFSEVLMLMEKGASYQSTEKADNGDSQNNENQKKNLSACNMPKMQFSSENFEFNENPNKPKGPSVKHSLKNGNDSVALESDQTNKFKRNKKTKKIKSDRSNGIHTEKSQAFTDNLTRDDNLAITLVSNGVNDNNDTKGDSTNGCLKLDKSQKLQTESNLSDYDSHVEDNLVKKSPRQQIYQKSNNFYDESKLGKIENKNKYLVMSHSRDGGSDDDDLLETNEEVTVNRPYERCFEVNKNKDLFIRAFMTQAKIINKTIMKTENSFDALSQGHRQVDTSNNISEIDSDHMEISRESNMKPSKQLFSGAKRSKSLLNIQGFASEKARKIEPKKLQLPSQSKRRLSNHHSLSGSSSKPCLKEPKYKCSDINFVVVEKITSNTIQSCSYEESEESSESSESSEVQKKSDSDSDTEKLSDSSRKTPNELCSGPKLAALHYISKSSETKIESEKTVVNGPLAVVDLSIKLESKKKSNSNLAEVSLKSLFLRLPIYPSQMQTKRMNRNA